MRAKLFKQPGSVRYSFSLSRSLFLLFSPKRRDRGNFVQTKILNKIVWNKGIVESSCEGTRTSSLLFTSLDRVVSERLNCGVKFPSPYSTVGRAKIKIELLTRQTVEIKFPRRVLFFGKNGSCYFEKYLVKWPAYVELRETLSSIQ